MISSNNDGSKNNEGYFKSTAHNFVSRKAEITAPKQFDLNGRSILHPNVKVDSDKQIVRIGRYSEVGEGTLLEPPPHPLVGKIMLLKEAKNNDGADGPPPKNNNNKKLYIPMLIGSHTRIGRDCEIRAAAIGGSEL